MKTNDKRRTIRQFLLKMPQPYMEQALLNAGENSLKGFKGRTIKDALMSAFVWNDSPEGGDYWNDFANNELL